MRLLGTLAAVPLIFSAYVAAEHGYVCSDAEGNTDTTYDQALVEKSVTDACLPDSQPSATELAANVAAKRYPQVWADSDDYGFNETVLLWKLQGNGSASQEEAGVLVSTDKSCNILGLLQLFGDQYTICKGDSERDDAKATTNTLPKIARRGFFFDSDDENEDDDDTNNLHGYAGTTSDNAITLPSSYERNYDSGQRQNNGWDYSRRIYQPQYSDQPASWHQGNDDTSSVASTEYGTASQDFSSTTEDDGSQYSAGGSSRSYRGSRSVTKGFKSIFGGSSGRRNHIPASRDFPSTRDPPQPNLSRERPSGWVNITPGPPTRPVPTGGYTMRPHRPQYPYGPDGTAYVPDNTSDDPPYISGEDHVPQQRQNDYDNACVVM